MNEHHGPDQDRLRSNPFGVADVPEPQDDAAVAFAATVALDGSTEDENASAWGGASDPGPSKDFEGVWSSRWNGGADPTIPGDAPDRWKHGKAELKTAGDRVYLLFDWNDGARWGLIHARRLERRPARRQIRQPDRSEHRAPLDGPDRERQQDRRTLAGRSSRFPQAGLALSAMPSRLNCIALRTP